DADDEVVRRDHFSINDALSFDDADTKASQIVIATSIKVGHDGGFAAEKSTIGFEAAACDAGDNLFQQRRIVMRHSHVIKKKQRFCPAAESIVYAHGHQIDADGAMAANELCHFKLCAYAVGATDEDWLFVVSREEMVGKIELE